jgi:hypothetical protein
MQTSPAELFAELVGHDYTIHALPGRKLSWDRRVKLGDLAGLEADSFVNLVAVPPSSATPCSELPLPAEARYDGRGASDCQLERNTGHDNARDSIV